MKISQSKYSLIVKITCILSILLLLIDRSVLDKFNRPPQEEAISILVVYYSIVLLIIGQRSFNSSVGFWGGGVILLDRLYFCLLFPSFLGSLFLPLHIIASVVLIMGWFYCENKGVRTLKNGTLILIMLAILLLPKIVYRIF